jgi:hypothetical protein
MLVEYTPIASLSPMELNSLKNAVRGMTLEGRGSHFVFQGRTFSMSELIGQQRMWEHEPKSPGKALFG